MRRHASKPKSTRVDLDVATLRGLLSKYETADQEAQSHHLQELLRYTRKLANDIPAEKKMKKRRGRWRLWFHGSPALKQVAYGRGKMFEQATDEDVEKFVKQYGEELTLVSFVDCSAITDAAVVALSKGCPHIQSIYLSGCQVSDAMVVLKACHDIQKILVGNKIVGNKIDGNETMAFSDVVRRKRRAQDKKQRGGALQGAQGDQKSASSQNQRKRKAIPKNKFAI